MYLAFNIEDLEKCSEENIKSIEKHLDSNSYLLGYEPSALDKDAYKSLKTRKFSNWQDFPNLQRWFCHIESFSSDEQNAFMVEKNQIVFKLIVQVFCSDLIGEFRRFFFDKPQMKYEAPNICLSCTKNGVFFTASSNKTCPFLFF